MKCKFHWLTLITHLVVCNTKKKNIYIYIYIFLFLNFYDQKSKSVHYVKCGKKKKNTNAMHDNI